MLLFTRMRLMPTADSANKPTPTPTTSPRRRMLTSPSRHNQRDRRLSATSSPRVKRASFASGMSISTAGTRVKLVSRMTSAPKATSSPNTLTGMMCPVASAANPAAVVRSV